MQLYTCDFNIRTDPIDNVRVLVAYFDKNGVISDIVFDMKLWI